jgi:hypothetical protein
VLHTPHNVGNQPQQLARAEREIGLDSWCVAFEETYRRYPTDEVLVEPHESRLLLEAKRWGLLSRALRRYDVVHFNSGQSLMPPPAPFAVYAPGQNELLRRAHYLYGRAIGMNDLYLLRKAGKGIVVTYQGDDARQGTAWGRPGSPFEIPLAEEADHYTVEGDAEKKRAIVKIARYADRIFYVNPDLAAVLPETATFLPYASLDPRQWQPSKGKANTSSPPLVVHAPFQQGVKGSRFVLDAVRRLQAEGVEFEFVLLEGKTFEEARRLYERADLLVDQLLLGWYGGIAVEFMALAKPVVCHIRESDLGVLPDEMRSELPLVRATTETIYDVLREWLTERRDELPEVGRRGRAYVERWHDPLKIAAELKGVYEEIASS